MALTVGIEGNFGIRIWDLVRKNLIRPTVDDVNDHVPLWTLDSQRIAFYSQRSATSGIHWMNADGTGKVELLFRMPGRTIAPQCWSGGGSTLLISSRPRAYLNYDIGSLSVEGDRAWKPLLQEEHAELLPQISPDGKWMAYMSNESGQNEIYVRSYPDVNKGRMQVSTSGGTEPRWSPDGRELFYRNGNAVMAALVKTEPIFSLETPKILFQGAFASYTFAEGILPYFTWDISPDGKRFLMMKEAAAEDPRKINIVLNWFEELKERMPVD